MPDLARRGSGTSWAAFHRPALIIQGAQDVMDPGIAQRAHALLPESELVILDQSGHYGWLDQPEQWLSTVNAFLLAAPLK